MSWPTKDQLIDAVDWSWYQQNGDRSPIDVPAFCATNPNVEVFILRAAWPSGKADAFYPVYYDALTALDKRVVSYIWPNPIRTLDEMRGNWWYAMGQGKRVPRAIMVDFELTFFQEDTALTDNAAATFAALDEDYPDAEIIGYTRANWWELHIKRPIEHGRKFILAHYPLLLIDGKWQQARSHTHLHRNLPIDNNFTPYMGKRFAHESVIGWQFSARGRLAPYQKDMDLDSLKVGWVNSVWKSGAPADEPFHAEVVVPTS